MGIRSLVTNLVTKGAYGALVFGLFARSALAQDSAATKLHSVPVVITAKSVRALQYHPLSTYRVFRSAADGTAEPIPFQIDERDNYGDFILRQGPEPNTNYSNGIFDQNDELSIMGSDIGPVAAPRKWPGQPPSALYEVTFTLGSRKGAVYVGVFHDAKAQPPLSTKSYVSFDLNRAEITTPAYRYRFDRKNYLIIRGVDINQADGRPLTLIDSSTFFLKADLKYFLTFAINQSDVRSELEAFTVGPIRTTARVKFNYKILKLNFDLGMYTEVSFFSNMVLLPAVIDNPLEGSKSLNKGSLFYYGFSMIESPQNLSFTTNMPAYGESNLLNLIKSGNKVLPQYWITATHPQYMFYLEMRPSRQMQASGNVPMFYKEGVTASQLRSRSGSAAPLGESPVNLAMALDLTAFSEGRHEVAMRLFVENRNDPTLLQEFKTAGDWQIDAQRLAPNTFK